MNDRAKKFPVLEVFGPTIQGEGSVIGLQTMFVRFGGCDYHCKRCDSLHAVLPRLIKEKAVYLTAQEIAERLRVVDCPMVTLSGGNPCMWDLMDLVHLLHGQNRAIAVETQGTLNPSWLAHCDYITVSPKGPGMGEKFEPDKFDMFVESYVDSGIKFSCKVVIFDQRDIEFAKQIAVEWPDVPLYLSLGNPWPPAPADQNQPYGTMSLEGALLARMDSLWNDIKLEPVLAKARFLPQLHVLLYGNMLGK